MIMLCRYLLKRMREKSENRSKWISEKHLRGLISVALSFEVWIYMTQFLTWIRPKWSGGAITWTYGLGRKKTSSEIKGKNHRNNIKVRILVSSQCLDWTGIMMTQRSMKKISKTLSEQRCLVNSRRNEVTSYSKSNKIRCFMLWIRPN